MGFVILEGESHKTSEKIWFYQRDVLNVKKLSGFDNEILLSFAQIFVAIQYCFEHLFPIGLLRHSLLYTIRIFLHRFYGLLVIIEIDPCRLFWARICIYKIDKIQRTDACIFVFFGVFVVIVFTVYSGFPPIELKR